MGDDGTIKNPPKPTFLEGFLMVNKMVFRWLKTFLFPWVLGGHGIKTKQNLHDMVDFYGVFHVGIYFLRSSHGYGII